MSTALSTHDYQYQTKALVNIASLFLEIGDTHRAIVHYEKLLALEKEIKGETDSILPAYWTHDLRCALHLNLSIAYKTIGSIEYAVHYARLYTKLVEESGVSIQVKAQSYHNEGLLNEILHEYPRAVECYQNYLKQSKKAGDKRAVAQAYGCLGSVYSALGNYNLSMTFHEQHVSLASKLGDPRSLALAHEQLGDSKIVFEEFEEAVECFLSSARSGARNDLRLQTSALCKIGKTYRSLKRYQYSLYYFEQAKVIAEDFEFNEIKSICEYNLACILQNSTQMFEIDQAERYFTRLIPAYEAKIHQHREEDTFCPTELLEQLENCYLGIIHIYAKSGNRDDALVYSESFRKKQASLLVENSLTRSTSLVSLTSLGNTGHADTWNIEKLLRVVGDQNSAVVYYTLLPSFLAVWVLLPGEGIARFYTSKQQVSNQEPIGKAISRLMNEILKNRNTKELVYDCENRSLPERDSDTKLLKNANKKLRAGTEGGEKCTSGNNLSAESTNLSMGGPGSQKDSKTNAKGPDRELFDILLAPVYDILSKLDPGSPVIIVPHKELMSCPFGIIRDWDLMQLKDRFRITVMPSLFLLEKVVQNELQQMRLEDNIEFLRTQSQMGGLRKLASSMGVEARKTPAFNFSSRLQVSESDCSPTGMEEVDTRRTSNPRLAKSGALLYTGGTAKCGPSVAQTARTSKMSVMPPKALLKQIPSPPKTVPLKGVQPIGVPSKPEKLMSVHTMTTLTTKTSTNTDITKAECGVADFKQVSDPEKCLVIGSPCLPER